jgi:NitT/TauT family transport system substrate-binding protein
VARAKGFFAEEGLDVTFQHGIETDFLKLIGTDAMQFAVGSGEQVILGRAQGLPLTSVATWYRKFPVVVFAPAASGIEQPKDLEGKRVGIPGLFGASLIGWKAMADAAGVDESAVSLESIGFTQAAAVSEGRVDAALDYIVNGPVQLRLAGQDVNVIPVANYSDLPANGLVTNDKTIEERPDLVQRMVTAMLKGIRYTLDHPDEAFAISLEAVPEAGGENAAVNRAIFDASLDLWQPPAAGLGMADPGAWQQAADFMGQAGLIDKAVPTAGIATNRFVEAAGVD